MIRRAFPCLSLLSWSIVHAASPPDDIEDAFGTKEAISLATGYTQPLFEAPATATVLTADELSAIGARTLSDALQLVPGFLVSTDDGRATVTTVRGITSRTLILIDGVPSLTTLLQPYQSLDNVLLHNVQRLEIVRGPASSIYGADAVAGVINIITRTGAHTDSEIGVSGGAFDTYEGWYLQSFQLSEADVSVYVGGRSTDWSDGFIAADAQSFLDRRFGTQASEAPTELPTHRDMVEARVDASMGDWTFRAHYLDISNWETALANSIDSDASQDSRFYGGTVLYKAPLSEDWQVTAFVDYSDIAQPAEGRLYPPGAFGGAFPDGVWIDYNITNERGRLESTAIFTGWRNHTLRIGGGVNRSAFRVAKEFRNFIVRRGQILPTGMFGPRGGVNDTPGIPDVDQTNYYGYFQDQWAIAQDWSVTAGVRIDDYSDFGTTTNPRLGVVWNARQDLTLKLLAGSAFRPPSIWESYSEGVYTPKGNRSIDPTTLDSAEASVNYRTARTSSSLSAFWYQQDDLIQITPDPTSPRGTAYTNRGTESGDGLELETTIQLPHRLRVHAGYAYHQRHGATVEQNVNLRYAARNAVNLDLTWEPAQDWTIGLTALSLFDRQRAATDPRPPADDYTWINATVTRANIAGVVDLSFSVRNLLNEDARAQSDSPNNVPDDIPLPGRGAFVTLLAHW
jgi:outer membrane receptor for ferrienterochelin and colicins